MKIQDFAFFIAFLSLLIYGKPKILVGAAIVCLLLSIPLFQLWIFFTAQRLVEYAFFFLVAALLLSFKKS